MGKRILLFLFVCGLFSTTSFGQGWVVVLDGWLPPCSFCCDLTGAQVRVVTASGVPIPGTLGTVRDGLNFTHSAIISGSGSLTSGTYIQIISPQLQNGFVNITPTSMFSTQFCADAGTTVQCSGGSNSIGGSYFYRPRIRLSNLDGSLTQPAPACRQRVRTDGCYLTSSYRWEITDNIADASRTRTISGGFQSGVELNVTTDDLPFFNGAQNGRRWVRAVDSQFPGKRDSDWWVLDFAPSGPVVNMVSSSVTPPDCPNGAGKINIVHSSVAGATSYVYSIVQLVPKGPSPCTAPGVPMPTPPTNYCYGGVGNATDTNTGDNTFVLDGVTVSGLSLTKGKYHVKIEANISGVVSCYGTYEFEITDPPAVAIGSTVYPSSPPCKGGENGSATFFITSGKGPFSWSVDGPVDRSGSAGLGAVTLNANLKEGDYTIAVTDNGCSRAATPVNFTVATSSTEIKLLDADVTHERPTCLIAPDGTITATATPLLSNRTYTFQIFSSGDLSTPLAKTPVVTANTAVFSGLSDLGYVVKVETDNKCKAQSTTETLETPNDLVVDYGTTNPTCSNSSDGSIRLRDISKANGGSINYSYTLSDGSTNVATGTGTTNAVTTIYSQMSSSKSYTLTVKDKCIGDKTVKSQPNIRVTNPLPISIVQRVDTMVACFDDVFSRRITIKDGTTSYAIDVKLGTTSLPGYPDPSETVKSFFVNNIGIGTYTLTATENCSVDGVTDASATMTFNVTSNASSVLTAKLGKPKKDNNKDGLNNSADYNLTCSELSDGAIEVLVKGGVQGTPAKYNFEILNSSLQAVSGTVSAPTPKSGGRLAYTISDLADSITYRIRITDSNTNPGGCVKRFDLDSLGANLLLYSPQPLTIQRPDLEDDFSNLEIYDNKLYVSCKGNQNGIYRSYITGGNPPYTVKLFKKATSAAAFPATPFAEKSNVMVSLSEFQGLGVGFYRVEVLDQQSCYFIPREFEIKEADQPINVTRITPYVYPHGAHTECYGDSNGRIEVQAVGGVGEYTYVLKAGSTIVDFAKKPQTLHTFSNLRAIDDNGQKITYTVSLFDEVNCYWDGLNGVSPTLQLTPPDTVEFSWKIMTRTVPGYEIPCHGDHAIIRIQSEGGKYSHEPKITGVSDTYISSLSGDNVFVEFSLPAGTYQATLEDALGCDAVPQTITLVEPGSHVQILPDTLMPPICIGGTDGQIIIGAENGEPSSANGEEYSFVVKKATDLNFDTDTLKGTSVTFLRPANFYNAQDYTLRVIDRFKCVSDSVMTMFPNPAPLTISFDTLASPSCRGGTDGFITVRASNYEMINGTSLTFKLAGGHLPGVDPDTLEQTVGDEFFTFANLRGTDLEGREPYKAWIVDANGCAEMAYQYNDTLHLKSYEAIEIDLVEMIRPTCFNGADGSLYVEVSGGVPPYQYSMNSNAFQPVGSGFRIFERDLRTGNFQFYVRDVQYKVDQPACQIHNTFEVERGRFIRPEGEIETVSCKGGEDGSIILTTYVDHRPPGESYDSSLVDIYWTHDNISSLAISTDTAMFDLPNGTFTAHLSYDADSVICTTEKSFIIHEPAAPFVINSIVTFNSSCGSHADGKVIVNVSGGWPGSITYYRLDNTTWTPFQGSSFIVQNLSPASHSIEIAQRNFQCVDNRTFDITSAPLPLAKGIVISPTCPMNTDGSVSLTSQPSGVLYSFEDGTGQRTTPLFENIAAGTYRFIAKKNGDPSCVSDILTVIVSDPSDCGDGALRLTEALNSKSTCAVSLDGHVKVTAAGGTPPYQYFWDDSAVPQSNDRDDLLAGVHSVTVRDAMEDEVTLEVTITSLPEIEIGVFTAMASCATTCDGEINVTASGGSGDFNILWDHDNSNHDFNAYGLCASNYLVKVTDDRSGNCFVSETIPLDHYPDLTVELVDYREPTCPGGTNGYLAIESNGGSGDHEVMWSSGAPSKRLEGVVPGDYTVTIHDRVLGCALVQTFNLPDAQGIEVVSTMVTPPLCHGYADGKAELVLSNVRSPLIRWETGDMGKLATGLQTGTCSYTVTSASGCSITGQAIIPDQPALLAEGTSNAVTCYETCDGTIMLSPAGGTTPYFVSWQHGPRALSLSGLCAADYQYTITDNHNCRITGTVEVLSPEKIVVVSEATDPLCHSGQDGHIAVETAGGIAPYIYEWEHGGSESSINNLAAGVYTINVSDANDCHASATITLQHPDAILLQGIQAVDPSCPQSTDGSIQFKTVGGTSPYTFEWNDGNSSENRAGLSSGDFTVKVVDQHECTYSRSFRLESPLPVEIVDIETVDPHCSGDANGSISLRAIGGVEPYAFSWSNRSSSSIQTKLLAGNYSVKVTDDNGCSVSGDFVLTNPTVPVIGGIPSNIIICTGGIAATEPSGEWKAFTWTGPQDFLSTNRRFETKKPGDYQLVALDNRSCPATIKFKVEVSPNAMVADFLRISEARAFEPVVFIDISQPVPSMVEWIIPEHPDISVNKESTASVELIFTASGTFEIGMKAFLDNCLSELYKTVVVTERDSNGGNSGGRETTDIGPAIEVTLYPNPASDALEIKVHSLYRDPIVLRFMTGLDNRTILSETVEGYLDYLINWNISEAKPGVHYIIYQQNEVVGSKRIIVIK